MEKIISYSKNHGNKIILVDDEDFEDLSRYKWSHNKRKSNKAYPCASINKEVVYMHRYLMKCPKGLVVDHIDGNTLNNQKSNLRNCTLAQNNINTAGRKNSISKYKGVLWDSSKKLW